MFKFDKISVFDFNKLYESRISFSLDDFDDEEDLIGQQTTVIKDDHLNFDLFLMSNVFDPIGITAKIGTETSKIEPVRYAWKKVNYENNDHYIAYIYIYQHNKDYHLYIDLNYTTKELYIGNCNSFERSKYFTVSYPLIKICERYAQGPVYIGDIYVDRPYGYKETPEDTLKKINLPFNYIELTQEITFYFCQWNGVKYYYPYDGGLKKNDFTEIDKNVKLSHNFIEHLKDFKNHTYMDYKVNTNVYYNAFEDWHDFLKLVILLCEIGATVNTDFGFKFNQDNYEDKLPEFKELIEENLGTIEEKKQRQAALEEKCKAKIQSIFPAKLIDHFESINKKSPRLLSTKIMFKERKSSDPYRKFDLPVINLMLKDNGIDIDKLIEESEKKYLNILYKFINVIDKHFDNIKCVPTYKADLFQRIFISQIHHPVYPTTDGDRKEFDGLTKEELQLVKDIMKELKVLETDEHNVCVTDISKLDNKSEETQKLAIAVDCCFGNYPNDNIGKIIYDMGSNRSEAVHLYNKFILLQRFVYLFSKIVIDDHNESLDNGEQHWKYPETYGLYSYNYTYIQGGNYYPSSYVPLNIGDNWIRLNNYIQLYKFLKLVAYVIENGYNITIPNLGCVDDKLLNNILRMYGEEEYSDKIIDDEFNYDNKPNIDLLNMDSIIKMFQTIFTNIDKKL